MTPEEEMLNHASREARRELEQLLAPKPAPPSVQREGNVIRVVASDGVKMKDAVG